MAKTFTFDAPDFGRLLDELNAGYIVTLTKANGASLILQHVNGDTFRFTIRPKADAGTSIIQVKNVLINSGELCDFLVGLEFASYESIKA